MIIAAASRCLPCQASLLPRPAASGEAGFADACEISLSVVAALRSLANRSRDFILCRGFDH